MQCTSMSNSEAFTGIVGYEKLISLFGYWPTFHDAEVLKITVDRGQRGVDFAPKIDVEIYLYEMTSELDEQGNFVLKSHSKVHIQFRNIAKLQIDDFNHQNALWGILFEHTLQDNLQFQVTFESSYGFGAEFRCCEIEVVSVIPCNCDGVSSTIYHQ